MTGALATMNPDENIAGMTGVMGFVTRILGPKHYSYYVFSFLKRLQMACGVF